MRKPACGRSPPTKTVCVVGEFCAIALDGIVSAITIVREMTTSAANSFPVCVLRLILTISTSTNYFGAAEMKSALLSLVKGLRPLATIPATRIGSGSREIVAAEAMAFLANDGEVPLTSK